MMFSISSITYDPSGARIMQLLGDPLAVRTSSRRATRTATLDGGCTVYDSGYAVADRRHDFTTCARHLDWLEYMVHTYRLVLVSTADGCYLAIPSRITGREGQAIITLDYTEQLS